MTKTIAAQVTAALKAARETEATREYAAYVEARAICAAAIGPDYEAARAAYDAAEALVLAIYNAAYTAAGGTA